MLLIIIGVHLQIVERELLLYPLLEGGALLQRQAIALRNNRHNIDKLAQFLQHHNINWLQRVAGWLDEEQAAVDARILEVSVTLGRKLFAEVSTVLVLDVLDYGVPAALVVDEVAVAGGIDDVEAEAHPVFLDDV